MGSERRLKALLDVVLSEMRVNSIFAERISAVLEPAVADTPQKEGALAPAHQPSVLSNASKRGNRRAVALVDPLTAIQSGEQHLRAELSSLDLEELRDVLAEYRMDPNKLAMKWKDRDRVIDHIVATAIERGKKGDAFRT